MTIREMKIGMKLNLQRSSFDYARWGRVEGLGYDWAVVRDERERLHLILPSDEPLKEHVEGDEEEEY